jgi:hypothetical protein
MANAADRDLPFLHGFEKGGLRFRRCAVDLVGKNDVGEQRTGNEFELALARRAVFFDHFGAGDVGRHQVRRELNTAESQRQRTRQR